MTIGYNTYHAKSTPIVPILRVHVDTMPDSDSKLPHLRTQQERLQWARAQHFSSPRAAAREFDWPQSSYKSHENGLRSKRGLQIDDAKKYAKAFRVPLEWLLTGDRRGMAADQALGRNVAHSQQSDMATQPIRITEQAENDPNAEIIDSRVSSDSHTVPVVGYVEAGQWREMSEYAEVLDYVGVDLPDLAGIKLRAHRVRGASVNRQFPEGWSVIYVPIPSEGFDVQDDDWVILRRPSRASAHEITIKQLKRVSGGKLEFWPLSDDPRWVEPIIPPERDELAQEGMEIVGVVVDSRPPRVIRSGRNAFRK